MCLKFDSINFPEHMGAFDPPFLKLGSKFCIAFLVLNLNDTESDLFKRAFNSAQLKNKIV